MWHGWHTAAEDVPPMHPAPGLLFATYYRGERDNGFEDFKYIVAPFDPPAAAANSGHETRQAGGRPAEAPPSQAPEGGATSPSPPSGSTGQADLRRIDSVAKAKAYYRGQSERWKVSFQRLAEEAREAGEAEGWSELEGFHKLAELTDAAMAKDQAA